MNEERFTFGVRGLGLLADLKTSFEREGFTCTVETGEYKGFELHTLVVNKGKKTNPIKFTRAK